MSLHAHYTTVHEKHGKLEGLIAAEFQRPYPDLAVLQTLKKQKLLLKEELERIRLAMAESERHDAA